MANGYFEGTLQLRNPSKELMQFVRQKIKENPNVWIAKEVKLKDGIDIYMSSWRYLLKMGNWLKQEFTGDLKTSRRLFGASRETSRILYRVTVYFKQRDLKVGDIVRYRGKQMKVKQLGHKVQGIDTETGKRMCCTYEEAKHNSI